MTSRIALILHLVSVQNCRIYHSGGDKTWRPSQAHASCFEDRTGVKMLRACTLKAPFT